MSKMDDTNSITESRTLLYERLNCVPESSPEQIRAEYRNLALRFHPDKTTKNDKDDAAFEQIQRAYAVLSDSARRALYDRWRMSHLQIPFEVFEGLGTHAQTLHWQSLPSQQTITSTSDEPSSSTHFNQPIPSQGHEEIRIQSVWKANDSDGLYNKFRNYEI